MGTPWPGAASAAGLHEPIHWVDLQQATERRQGKKVAPSTICFDPSKPLVPNEVLALRHGSHRRTQTWHFACSSGALVLRCSLETLAALSSPSIRGGGPNGASTWRKNAPARRSIGSRSRYGRSGSRSHSVRNPPVPERNRPTFRHGVRHNFYRDIAVRYLFMAEDARGEQKRKLGDRRRRLPRFPSVRAPAGAGRGHRLRLLSYSYVAPCGRALLVTQDPNRPPRACREPRTGWPIRNAPFIGPQCRAR